MKAKLDDVSVIQNSSYRNILGFAKYSKMFSTSLIPTLACFRLMFFLYSYDTYTVQCPPSRRDLASPSLSLKIQEQLRLPDTLSCVPRIQHRADSNN